MRIAVINWTSRTVGGSEVYVDGILAALASSGHGVSLWHELDLPADRPHVRLPDGAPAWCVATLGAPQALAALRGWRPDVLYTHGLIDPALERETLDVAPAVFFAHAYSGTCISGSKTFRLPVTRPCHRRFGWQCLALYYPRRCGGVSPLTMLRDYRLQWRRLRLLRRYGAIVTRSRHMRSEYVKHGIPADRVHNFHFGAGPMPACAAGKGAQGGGRATTSKRGSGSWKLLFIGRMDAGKGGSELLRALPAVVSALGARVEMTFVGEGTLRARWQEEAARVADATAGLDVQFTGWISGAEERKRWLAESDLLVLPSVWPEPFGLVGPEAAHSGLPVAAFAVGGIPEWLKDGVNGHLAPGSPPTAEGLGAAIVACLSDPDHHASLRRGAVSMAGQFDLDRHTPGLVALLESVAAAGKRR